ncbi:hypothetical protein H5410_004506 [Solanum commersonii]|uniref:Uncharacterized protein n=1 Tax=Solanum commersonii TaxID=4109 RepID=A0A9J6B7J4_SOLCO|nr:hypothetical protein H5410_004506 [Solanum commersonii]
MYPGLQLNDAMLASVGAQSPQEVMQPLNHPSSCKNHQANRTDELEQTSTTTIRVPTAPADTANKMEREHEQGLNKYPEPSFAASHKYPKHLCMAVRPKISKHAVLLPLFAHVAGFLFRIELGWVGNVVENNDMGCWKLNGRPQTLASFVLYMAK